jgi:hypothetical protein
MTLKVKEQINLGQCPLCKEHTHFNPTKKAQYFTCAICEELVEQKINGKVLYKEVTLPGIVIDS